MTVSACTLNRTLYKSAILPNLTYCHIVWHVCKASDARKLERLQERALRAVYNDRNATYEELLEKGRLSSLENRRLQDILILMYNVKNSLAPLSMYVIYFFSKISILTYEVIFLFQDIILLSMASTDTVSDI